MLDIISFTMLFDVPFDASDFMDKLLPNGIEGILTQFLAFLVMVIIVTYLGYKPLKKFLNTRATYIEDKIKEAEAANEVALERENVSRHTIISSKKEAEVIIDNAKDAAEKVQSEIISEGRKTLREERLKMIQDIELAKIKAAQDIEQEIVSVALEASKLVVGREITLEDNARLIEEFIKEVKK